MRIGGLIGAVLAMVVVTTRPGGTAADAADAVLWHLDSLATIGGHPVTVLGAPRVVQTDGGEAVVFNGSTDGLILDVNPLAGLERFTIEVLFAPAPDGLEEQRFLHFEEAGSSNRALMETRRLPDGSWCLDTYLRDGDVGLTLLDRRAAHPSGRWHAVALAYDGKTMAHFVDGVREAAGDVRFRPLGAGRTSIGVRQNRVSWFKGTIRLVRITPEALSPDRQLAASVR